MTTTTEPEYELYIPDVRLVHELAGRVIAEFGADARLPEIETLADDWPEIEGLDEGQIEELFEEIRDTIAATGNGRRR